MVGDRLDGDRERLRELGHGRLAMLELLQDRPPGRIGERGKSGAELVDRHGTQPESLSTDRLQTEPTIQEVEVGRIVVSEFVSLDGVMEDPGGAEGIKYGGWTFEINRGPDGDKFKLDETVEAEALLLGRRTYEGFAAAWPNIT